MNISREGKLTNSEVGTGDILSLELLGGDAAALVEHGQIVDRFVSFKHHNMGWDLMDKAWVFLGKPVVEEEVDKIADLSLDTGGDLYFKLFDNDTLRNAGRAFSCAVFQDLEALVSSDPSQKLHRLGIAAVRIYGLYNVVDELTPKMFND